MFDDFDDDDADGMDYGSNEFEKRELDEFMERERERQDAVRNMPIYKKAGEILDTVRSIADLIPDDHEFLQYSKQYMLEYAYIIPAKIAGAEGGDLYAIRMGNAAIIRKAAMDLMVEYHSLTMHDFEHAEYFLMVRKQIEEFRLLFIEWVESFDKTNYIVDDWGLFNPPGVGPFDE